MSVFSDIVSGVSAATGVGNLASQANMNKKNRQWQEKMYAQQLADERENWNMQNEYNEEMYNKYSSPAAQARQMIEAGINPDFANISSSGGVQSASLGSASVPSSSGSPLDFVGAFANIFEIINKLESSQLDNQLKKAELDKLTKSTALDYLVKNFDPNYDDSDIVGYSDIMNDNIRSSRSVAGLSTYFRKQGLSRSAANQAARYVHTLDLTDVRSEYYKRRGQSDTNRKGYLTGRADPYYRDDDISMVSALNSFLSIQDDLDKFVKRAQKSKANYDADFYDHRSGANDASAESSILSSRSAVARQSANSGNNASKVDEEFNNWVDHQPKAIQVICRLFYRILTSSSVKVKGANIGF